MRLVPSLFLLAILLPASTLATGRVRVVCRDGVLRHPPAGAPAWKPACEFGGVHAVGHARLVRLPAVDVELLLRCR